MSDILEPKFDGARFDARRWYVDGYAMHWFTSKEDAQAAIGLAGQVEINARREMSVELQSALDRITP